MVLNNPIRQPQPPAKGQLGVKSRPSQQPMSNHRSHEDDDDDDEDGDKEEDLEGSELESEGDDGVGGSGHEDDSDVERTLQEQVSEAMHRHNRHIACYSQSSLACPIGMFDHKE